MYHILSSFKEILLSQITCLPNQTHIPKPISSLDNMVNLRNLFIQWHNIKINDTLEVGRNGAGFSSARCIPDKFHNCDSMDAIMADLQEHKAIRPRVSFSALPCTRTYKNLRAFSKQLVHR
mmetsp:Transcript_32454/g.55307  ORF Transcript_32454/g.55307 Transcript_32454/m.55307 type:complete len:121 (+) Transcript_32454:22-384(+)